MKYSNRFNRDYEFYLKNIGKFNFCGTLSNKYVAIPDDNGKSAKEVFYLIDSMGKNIPTREPGLLNDLLFCKASLNFMIKQWAEGRADGSLPKCEFVGNGKVLYWEEYINNKGLRDAKVVYKGTLEVEYDLPNWVIKAVENQKLKILRGIIKIYC